MNLIQGLQQEINRVMEIVDEYKSLPSGAGMIAARMLLADIKEAQNAIGTSNTVAMLQCLKKLKEHELG